MANDNLSESTTTSTPMATVVDIALPEDSVVKNESSGSSANYCDIYVGYGPKSKLLAYSLGIDVGKYAYFTYFSNMGLSDANERLYVIGLGPKYRYADKSLMAFGSAYVYGGYGAFEYDTYDSKGHTKTKTKRDFAYGLAFDFKLGACINQNKRGERSYLSVGYQMKAGDFKFKKIGKFGIITLSYTMKL